MECKSTDGSMVRQLSCLVGLGLMWCICMHEYVRKGKKKNTMMLKKNVRIKEQENNDRCLHGCEVIKMVDAHRWLSAKRINNFANICEGIVGFVSCILIKPLGLTTANFVKELLGPLSLPMASFVWLLVCRSHTYFASSLMSASGIRAR